MKRKQTIKLYGITLYSIDIGSSNSVGQGYPGIESYHS